MQHVVQIIPALGYGGAERMVVDLINHSDVKKYRFTVVVFFDNAPLKNLLSSKAEVVLVAKKSKFDFGFLKRLEKTLSDLNPDIVHGHLFAGDFWGRLAAHCLNIPFLTTEHNLNYDDGWFKNFIKKIVSGRQDYYLACSMAVSDYMRSVYKIKNEIRVINNGVDLSRFVKIPTAVWQEPWRFLMVGRLTKQKGQLIALMALNNLKKYPWQLTIVGSGIERANLENFIQKNHLSERVNIVEPIDQIEKYYHQADVLLMPSLWEGLGVAAMEAMASARLVVASKTGGLMEVIQDGETGYLVLPKNVAAWEEKIKYILENKIEAQNLAKQARLYAKKHFGLEQMIEKYDQIYSLVASK